MVRIARREHPHADWNGRTSGNAAVVAGCNTDALGSTRVPASCRCIANQCAMWRWAAPGEHAADTSRGYCGLAGTPIYAHQDQRVPF